MLTQHGSLLVLDSPLLANVVRNCKKDGHILFSCVLEGVQPSDDSEAPSLVDVVTSFLQLCLNCWERECIASQVGQIQVKFC